MGKAQDINSGVTTAPRICIFSQRHLHRLVSRCPMYEFEDVICEIDDVEVLVPESNRSFPVCQKIANRLARHISIASLNPGVRELRLDRNYELFVAMCQFPSDLLSLNALKGWKKCCQTSICWLAELWAGELAKFKGHSKLLSQFDYVVLNFTATVPLVEKVVDGTCTYMPPGVDAITFCPYPNPPTRCVDVHNLGRKSLVTHEALLKMADQGKIFYIYDTIPNMCTFYPKQHRNLVASIAKRSRYFLAYPAKVDQKCETHGQSETGYRFYEGAAAGTIMIGEKPDNEAFRKQFDWPDAVIRVPYDTANIAEVLADLDSQPERLARIRKNNVINCLLRHDWVYRWRAILDMVGLEPRPGLLAREERLRKLAEQVQQAC